MSELMEIRLVEWRQRIGRIFPPGYVETDEEALLMALSWALAATDHHKSYIAGRATGLALA